MGWWRINPKTGKPLSGSRSRLSRPGQALLNAVPGVDDEAQAHHYLGDFPCDCAAEMADKIGEFLDRHRLSCPSVAQLLTFVLDGVTPPSLAAAGSKPVRELLDSFTRIWADVDRAYEGDWGRPARREERLAACGERLKRLARDRRRAERSSG